MPSRGKQTTHLTTEELEQSCSQSLRRPTRTRDGGIAHYHRHITDPFMSVINYMHTITTESGSSQREIRVSQNCTNAVHCCLNRTSSHLGAGLAGLAVQAAYPSALHHLVVGGERLHLLSLVCGTIAGFQIGLLSWGFILGWSFDGLCGFHILVCFEFSPKQTKKKGNKMTHR